MYCFLLTGCSGYETVGMPIVGVGVLSISENRPAEVVIGAIGIHHNTCVSDTKVYATKLKRKTMKFLYLFIVPLLAVLMSCTNITTTALLNPTEHDIEIGQDITDTMSDNVLPQKEDGTTGIVHFGKIAWNANATKPPVWNLPSLEYEAVGSRLGDILNAKVLEDVENYASEVQNLRMGIVTGNVVPYGDGSGFALNEKRLKDLWVAGVYEDAPIVGTVTIWAENNKGKTPITLNVRITVEEN